MKLRSLAFASVFFAAPVAAQEYTLVISSWAPPGHVVNSVMWPGLIQRIEEATDGRVTADIRYDLAPPPAQADVVLDGAADLTYIFHGYNPGRFVATQMIELPGYEGDAEAASVAYWRAHEEFLAPLDEHAGFELIGLFTHGPAALHTVEPVQDLSDVAGLKLRLGGGVGGEIGTGLGATGIQVPAPRVYETLTSGTADGVFINIDSRQGFRLTEVAPHVLEVPGGFYRGSFAVLMNADTFADLPEDIQSILSAEVFGEPLSRAFGAAWDEGDANARAATEAATGNTIRMADGEELTVFNEAAESVTNVVFARAAERGLDAESVQAFSAAAMAADMAAR